MKKILVLIIVVATVFVAGCGKDKKNELNVKYTKVDSEIKEEINKIDINMEDISVDRLKTEYGIKLDLVENYISGINEPDLYIAIKPKEGKEEIVKKALKIYFENLEVRLSNYDNDGKVIETEELKRVKNRVEEEINGYYVYIVSSNNEEILKVIKDKIG